MKYNTKALVCRIDLRSHFDPLVRVEFKQFLRRNTDLRDATNVIAVHHKMIVPIIFPRMIKQNDFSSVRIKGCQVRPFVPIAIRTCQRKIVRRIVLDVLSRLYMFNMKSKEGGRVLVQATVLTAILSPIPN